MASSSSKPRHPLIFRFVLRWIVSSLGLWIAAGILKHSISYNHSLSVLVVSGLILAIVNTVLKPILIVLSLPALIFSLGLFMIIINGLTVYIVSRLYTSLSITTFWTAVFAGMVIGLVNYLITTILEGL